MPSSAEKKCQATNRFKKFVNLWFQTTLLLASFLMASLELKCPYGWMIFVGGYKGFYRLITYVTLP